MVELVWSSIQPKLLTPSQELWQEIVDTHQRFAVSDSQVWAEGPYYQVLRNARKRALETNGIVVAAFHAGKWYKIDVAYHPEHAI